MGSREDMIARIRARRASKAGQPETREAIIARLRSKGVGAENIEEKAYGPIQGEDRFFIKNSEGDKDTTLEHLRKKHAGSDFKYAGDGDLIGRDKGSKNWQKLDPDFKLTSPFETFEAQDISDLASTFAGGVAETAAIAGGGVAGLAGGPLGVGAGMMAGGAAGGAVTEGLKQKLAQYAGLRKNVDVGNIGTSAAISGITAPLFGAGSMLTKGLANKAAKSGVAQTVKNEAILKSLSEGFVISGIKKGAKGTGNFGKKILSNINKSSPDAVQTLFKKFDEIKDYGYTQLKEKTTELYFGIQDSLKATKAEKNLAYNSLKDKGVKVNVKPVLESLETRYLDIQRRFISKFRDGSQEGEILLKKYFDALKESKRNATDGLKSFSKNSDGITVQEAMDLKQSIGKQFTKVLEDHPDRNIKSHINDMVSGLDKEVTALLDTSLEKAGLGKNMFSLADIKNAEYRDLKKRVEKYVRTPQHLHKTLYGAKSKSGAQAEKLGELEEILDASELSSSFNLKGKAKEVADTLEAHKTFINSPELIPQAGSMFSATRGVGSAVGGLLGSPLGLWGIGTGAAIGNVAAPLLTGPAFTKGYAKAASKAAKGLGQANRVLAPKALGGPAARNKAIWNSIQQEYVGKEEPNK